MIKLFDEQTDDHVLISWHVNDDDYSTATLIFANERKKEFLSIPKYGDYIRTIPFEHMKRMIETLMFLQVDPEKLGKTYSLEMNEIMSANGYFRATKRCGDDVIIYDNVMLLRSEDIEKYTPNHIVYFSPFVIIIVPDSYEGSNVFEPSHVIPMVSYKKEDVNDSLNEVLEAFPMFRNVIGTKKEIFFSNEEPIDTSNLKREDGAA